MARIESIVIAAVRQAPKHPDPHRPLYALRVSASLHAELKEALSNGIRSSADLTTIGCAGFCLYAAGEFCRSHDSGPWKWETVRAPIGLQCAYSELYQIVERGLEYWHREIISTEGSRRLLTTLACEGGLPLSVLRQDQASLTRYFRRLLRESEIFSSNAVVEIAAREEITLLLPATLRQEQVYRLAADLITPIRSIRQKIPADAQDPIAAADKVVPGWRDSLPLLVDDDVVLDLLRGLLLEQRVSPRSAALVSVQCHLNLDTGEVRRQIALPSEAAPADLAQVLGVAEVDLPVRFRIYAHGGGGARQPVAVVTRFEDGFHLERLPVPEFGDDDRVELVARAGPRRIGDPVTLPGGDPLPVDAPWLFTNEADEPVRRLLGTGGLTTQRSSVLVLPPDDAEIAPIGSGSSTVIGHTRRGRRIVQLSGDAQISGGEDRWAVKINAQADVLPEFRMRGNSLGLGAGGSDVFLGCPSVWSSSEGRSLRADELEWKPAGAGGGSWRPVIHRPLGEVLLRHQHEGDTRFRARATVMPASFGIAFERGERPGEGILRLRNIGRCQVGSGTDECSFRSEQHGDDIRVVVTTSGRPPRTVPLVLRFDDGSRACLRFSYPEERRDFVRWSGELLDWNSRITLSDLNHLRAVVQTPRTGRSYVLRGEVWQTSDGHRSRGDVPHDLRELNLGKLQGIADGELEIPLDAVRGTIEAALAVIDDLNAEVRLKIQAEGETDPGLRYIVVSRYASRLTREPFLDGLAIGVEPSNSESSVRLVAMSVRDNFQTLEEIQQTSPGTWLLETKQRTPGAWLVACPDRRADAPRPLFVTIHSRDGVRPDEETLRLRREQRQAAAPQRYADGLEGRIALGEASNLGEPERSAAVEGIVAGCARSYSHSQWPAVLNRLESLSFLPAEGLILPRKLAQSPNAVVRALFLRPQLLDVLWDQLETLPFLWALLPLRAWLWSTIELPAHFTGVNSRLARDLGPEDCDLLDDPAEQARRRVDAVFARLERRAPYARVLRLGIHNLMTEDSRFFAPPPEPLHNLTRDELGRLQQRVLRMDIEWPSCDWKSLASRASGPGRELAKHLFSGAAAFKLAVLNAPLIAAWECINGECPATTYGHVQRGGLTTRDTFDLRRFIGFDEDWFERAYTYHLARLFGLPQH